MIFGEKDTIVDSAQSAEVYWRALTCARNTNVTVVTFPTTDHAIFTRKKGGMKELLEYFNQLEKHYSLGFLEAMASWLDNNFDRNGDHNPSAAQP